MSGYSALWYLSIMGLLVGLALILFGVFYVIFKLVKKEKMSAWLKGGIILLGIDFLFWLIFFISATQSTGDMAGMAVVGAFAYGGLSLIPAFIIGAIIGAISGWVYGIEKKIFTWSAKAGFFSSLIIYIIFFSYAAIYTAYYNTGFIQVWRDYHSEIPKVIWALQSPGWQVYVLGIFIIIAVTWLFWVIGGIIKKVRG